MRARVWGASRVRSSEMEETYILANTEPGKLLIAILAPAVQILRCYIPVILPRRLCVNTHHRTTQRLCTAQELY